MTKHTRELTTAEDWDEIWARWRQPNASSTLRRKLRKQREWEQLLKQLLDQGPERGSVLELGCAPGDMIRLLHSLRPARVYRGIDYAPLGIEVARSQLEKAAVPAELTVADIRTTEVACADMVVSFGLIEHFDDPADVLACHRRLTAPGGYTAVTVPNYAHPLVRSMLKHFSPATLDTHNLNIMNPTAMRRAFEAAGFVDVHAGYAGPASIPSSRVRNDVVGRAFATFARAWNIATEMMPARWPWANHVWGIGQRPLEP